MSKKNQPQLTGDIRSDIKYISKKKLDFYLSRSLKKDSVSSFSKDDRSTLRDLFSKLSK